MPTKWMSLADALSFAKQSPEWGGEQQVLDFLKSAELPARADSVTSAKSRGVRVLRNRETGVKRVLSKSPALTECRTLAPLEAAFWQHAELDFAKGRAVVKSRLGLTSQDAQGIRVDRASVESLWPRPVPASAPKNKGGVEPKYDWVGAVIEMAWIIYVEKTPPKGKKRPQNQAQLIERLKDWFETEPPRIIPGDSGLKTYTKRFLAKHPLPKKGRPPPA